MSGFDTTEERAQSCHVVQKTNIYLKRPQISSAFQVEVVVDDGLHGRLVGAELAQVAKFLRISEGVPVFDLEWAEHLFCRCHLSTTELSDSISFSFERSSAINDPKSEPGPSLQ